MPTLFPPLYGSIAFKVPARQWLLYYVKPDEEDKEDDDKLRLLRSAVNISSVGFHVFAAEPSDDSIVPMIKGRDAIRLNDYLPSRITELDEKIRSRGYLRSDYIFPDELIHLIRTVRPACWSCKRLVADEFRGPCRGPICPYRGVTAYYHGYTASYAIIQAAVDNGYPAINTTVAGCCVPDVKSELVPIKHVLDERQHEPGYDYVVVRGYPRCHMGSPLAVCRNYPTMAIGNGSVWFPSCRSCQKRFHFETVIAGKPKAFMYRDLVDPGQKWLIKIPSHKFRELMVISDHPVTVPDVESTWAERFITTRSIDMDDSSRGNLAKLSLAYVAGCLSQRPELGRVFSFLDYLDFEPRISSDHPSYPSIEYAPARFLGTTADRYSEAAAVNFQCRDIDPMLTAHDIVNAPPLRQTVALADVIKGLVDVKPCVKDGRTIGITWPPNIPLHLRCVMCMMYNETAPIINIAKTMYAVQQCLRVTRKYGYLPYVYPNPDSVVSLVISPQPRFGPYYLTTKEAREVQLPLALGPVTPFVRSQLSRMGIRVPNDAKMMRRLNDGLEEIVLYIEGRDARVLTVGKDIHVSSLASSKPGYRIVIRDEYNRVISPVNASEWLNPLYAYKGERLSVTLDRLNRRTTDAPDRAPVIP
jgi:hypothetical protein